MGIYRLLLFFIILLQLCPGCNEPSGESDPGCPFPPNYCDGVGETPVYWGKACLGRSPDNQKLALLVSFRDLEIYYIQTGQIQKFNFQKYLPSNVKYTAVDFALWCPYNSNKLLVNLITATDTAGNGKEYIWSRTNLIISLDEKEVKLIKPKIFASSSEQYYVICGPWLPGSYQDNDSIVIVDRIYLLQKDSIVTPKPGFKLIRSYSPDGKYIQTAEYDQNTETLSIHINGKILNFPEKVDGYYPSWSPDSKKLCLSVGIKYDQSIPCKDQRLSENWIIDIDKLFSQNPDQLPRKIINQRNQFCMYSYGGGNGEFISDTSLAISMFAPDGKFSYIWEVSVSGYLIRQMTTMP